jgi:hypothetical protein
VRQSKPLACVRYGDYHSDLDVEAFTGNSCLADEDVQTGRLSLAGGRFGGGRRRIDGRAIGSQWLASSLGSQTEASDPLPAQAGPERLSGVVMAHASNCRGGRMDCVCSRRWQPAFVVDPRLNLESEFTEASKNGMRSQFDVTSNFIYAPSESVGMIDV